MDYDDADWWKGQPESESDPEETADDMIGFNDTDRPPILRGRCCPMCGSTFLFCITLKPNEYRTWLQFFWHLIAYWPLPYANANKEDKIFVECSDCGWDAELAPWGSSYRA